MSLSNSEPVSSIISTQSPSKTSASSPSASPASSSASTSASTSASSSASSSASTSASSSASSSASTSSPSASVSTSVSSLSSSQVNMEKEVNNFYKLKAKYNEKISKIKQKVKNKNTLTKKDKQKEFRNIQFKCVNCNRPGGTLFEIKKNKLSALCGASSKCDLNISIDKKTYYNIRNEKAEVEEQINVLKTDIIKTKLDFLFNYIEESEAIKEFSIQKEDFNLFSKGLIATKKDYIEIVDNIETNTLLKETIILLHEKIIQIKDLEKNYIETKNTQLIEDIINIYKIDIIPLNNKIRELRYSYYNIVKDEKDNNIIIKTPYTLDKLFLQNV